jgi:hypothetical protein
VASAAAVAVASVAVGSAAAAGVSVVEGGRQIVEKKPCSLLTFPVPCLALHWHSFFGGFVEALQLQSFLN